MVSPHSTAIEYNRRVAGPPDVPSAVARAQGDIAMPLCEIHTNNDNALDKVTSAMVILPDSRHAGPFPVLYLLQHWRQSSLHMRSMGIAVGYPRRP